MAIRMDGGCARDAERTHQGLDNQLIDPTDEIGKTDGEIVCRERLGGMLKFYHRKAA